MGNTDSQHLSQVADSLEALNWFKAGRLIQETAQSSYGKSKIYYSKGTKMVWALKQKMLDDKLDQDKLKQFLKKRKESQTQFTVDLYNYFTIFTKTLLKTHFKIYMAFEYFDSCLENEIQHMKQLNTYFQEDDVYYMIYQCVQGMKYIYSEYKTSHLNLLPSNILYKNGVFKLNDLHIICNEDDQKINMYQNCLITGDTKNCFLSPELLQELSHRTLELKSINHMKSDIYSLGLCAIYMCRLIGVQAIYDFDSFKIKNEEIEIIINEIELIYSKNLSQLLQQMIHPNVEKRLDVDQIELYLQDKIKFDVKKVVIRKNNQLQQKGSNIQKNKILLEEGVKGILQKSVKFPSEIKTTQKNLQQDDNQEFNKKTDYENGDDDRTVNGNRNQTENEYNLSLLKKQLQNIDEFDDKKKNNILQSIQLQYNNNHLENYQVSPEKTPKLSKQEIEKQNTKLFFHTDFSQEGTYRQTSNNLRNRILSPYKQQNTYNQHYQNQKFGSPNDDSLLDNLIQDFKIKSIKNPNYQQNKSPVKNYNEESSFVQFQQQQENSLQSSRISLSYNRHQHNLQQQQTLNKIQKKNNLIPSELNSINNNRYQQQNYNHNNKIQDNKRKFNHYNNNSNMNSINYTNNYNNQYNKQTDVNFQDCEIKNLHLSSFKSNIQKELKIYDNTLQQLQNKLDQLENQEQQLKQVQNNLNTDNKDKTQKLRSTGTTKKYSQNLQTLPNLSYDSQGQKCFSPNLLNDKDLYQNKHLNKPSILLQKPCFNYQDQDQDESPYNQQNQGLYQDLYPNNFLEVPDPNSDLRLSLNNNIKNNSNYNNQYGQNINKQSMKYERSYSDNGIALQKQNKMNINTVNDIIKSNICTPKNQSQLEQSILEAFNDADLEKKMNQSTFSDLQKTVNTPKKPLIIEQFKFDNLITTQNQRNQRNNDSFSPQKFFDSPQNIQNSLNNNKFNQIKPENPQKRDYSVENIFTKKVQVPNQQQIQQYQQKNQDYSEIANKIDLIQKRNLTYSQPQFMNNNRIQSKQQTLSTPQQNIKIIRFQKPSQQIINL